MNRTEKEREKARRDVMAEIALAFAIANLCLEMGLDDIGLQLDRAAGAAERTFTPARKRSR